MGVTEDMLRLNVGLEDPQDVIDDLDQALAEGRAVSDVMKALFPNVAETRGVVVRVSVSFLPEQSEPRARALVLGVSRADRE